MAESVFQTVPLAVFGPGSLYVTRIDTEGNTPVNVGYVQEFSYDESAENKELYGTMKYPLVVAQATIKATGKMKNAVVSGLALNYLFTGQSFAPGQLLMQIGEPHTVPAAVVLTTNADSASGNTLHFVSTGLVEIGCVVAGLNIVSGSIVTGKTSTAVELSNPISGDVPSTTDITFGPFITVTESLFFDSDLGVVYADSNLPLMFAEGADLTAGQYETDALIGPGIYNFDVSDVGKVVNVTYSYEDADSGQTLLVKNEPIGTTPVYRLDYSTSLYGQPYYARFFACVSNKLSRAHKLTDFMMPEIDFGFFALSNGNVYQISYPQVS